MKHIDKKRVVYALIYIVVMIGFFFGKNYFINQERYNRRMYNDFETFGRALEELNNDLSRIFILEDEKFSSEKIFLIKIY